MTLALITGRGTLPWLVADAQPVPPLICAYEGTAPEGLVPDLVFRLETLGTLLVTLGDRGVTQVCFAGGIRPTHIDPALIDAETAPLVPLVQEALSKGDDGALRIILDIFQQTGFNVRGAHELAPALLADGGVYSDAWPTAQMRDDAEAGAAHIAEMGPRDIGQACIVIAGKVVAMEDAKGTDALIQRLAPFGADQNAVLFKGPKPEQLRLADLPTIGPKTIQAAGKAGLAGVIVDAGDVLVLERARCASLANEHDLVLWARTGE